MTFPNELQTERLLLRWPAAADADEIFARYARDSEVTRYITWRPHRSITETSEFLRNAAVERDAGNGFPWLIRNRESGVVLGMIGLRIAQHTGHLGYVLARDAWGQGFATEAARAVVSVGRHNESFWRIQATCDVENGASVRVLEKVGLQFEGTLRRHVVLPNLGDAPRDVQCYAVVRDAAGNWTSTESTRLLHRVSSC